MKQRAFRRRAKRVIARRNGRVTVERDDTLQAEFDSAHDAETTYLALLPVPPTVEMRASNRVLLIWL